MSETTPGHRLSRRQLLQMGGAAASLAAIPSWALVGNANAATTKAPANPTTAPVPPNAKGPAIPASGYLVSEIGDDLYWLTDGLYQMMFMVADHGVMAVDAPPTLGNNITRAIRSVTSKKVTDVVYSHQHADHIGAAVLYPERARVWAHKITAEKLAQVHDPNRPQPTHVFEKSRVLGEGRHRLQLDFHGPNHAEGNIFVFAPHQRTLLLVDVVFPGWVPFAYLAESSDIPGWITAHQQADSYPFDTFIGGHLTRLGNHQDIRTQTAYITELKDATNTALSSVDLNALYSSVDTSNPWAIFNGYLGAVATAASNAVVPNWTDTLGGADVFTWSNAWAMAEALRIDFGSLGPFGIRP